MFTTKTLLALSLCTALFGAGPLNPRQELASGVRAAEAYNWTATTAHVRYAQIHLPQADRRERTLAKVLFLRSTMEQRNLAELTREYRFLADDPAVKNDAELRMWLYIAKGDCDNDLQFPEASQRDWETVEQLASITKNAKWKYRAKGELAIPAYYMGDLAKSRKLVSEALEAASAANDYSSVVRLLRYRGDLSRFIEEALTTTDLYEVALLSPGRACIAKGTTASTGKRVGARLKTAATHRRCSVNSLANSAIAAWLSSR